MTKPTSRAGKKAPRQPNRHSRSADALWSDLEHLIAVRRLIRDTSERDADPLQHLASNALQALNVVASKYLPLLLDAAMRESNRSWARPIMAPLLTDTFNREASQGGPTLDVVRAVFVRWLAGLYSQEQVEARLAEHAGVIACVAAILETADDEAVCALCDSGVDRRRVLGLARAQGPRNQAQALAALLLDVDSKTVQRAERGTVLGRWLAKRDGSGA